VNLEWGTPSKQTLNIELLSVEGYLPTSCQAEMSTLKHFHF